MKKILTVLLFITALTQAQHTIKGTMSSTIETDWIILYKIEGATQKFIKDSKIKIDSITTNGTKTAVGTFEFTLPKNSKPGTYRATYRLKNAGFVDFIFNNENIDFKFNPAYPELSVAFTSEENKLYKEYQIEIFEAQRKLDSVHVTAIKNPEQDLKAVYKNALNTVNAIQNKYLKNTEGKYIQPFITASIGSFPAEAFKTPEEYMENLSVTFFNNIDFNNTTLVNSPFLMSRVNDYIFYINYSADLQTQQTLFKESINGVFDKIENNTMKKDVIVFLIKQFEEKRNTEIIDYLFQNYYDKLPLNLQDKKFKDEKLKLLTAEIGRTAPDFSWTENDKKLNLHSLNDAENYVLVFWSTACSHCLKEIPKLAEYAKDKANLKVIAFAIETDATKWHMMKNDLPTWHHALGLDKWENKTAREYNIHFTPNYFVLDKNKKIISKPQELKDLADFVDSL